MKSKAFIPFVALFCGALYAQTVEVRDAWIRTTMPGQQATGAFMKITAKQGARLVAVSSPVAGVAAVHEMKLDNGVMKMRAIPALDLPAGKTVELKPGSYHLMLMDLKEPLVKGSTVPLTLLLQDGRGEGSRLELSVPVSTTPVIGETPARPLGQLNEGVGKRLFSSCWAC